MRVHISILMMIIMHVFCPTELVSQSLGLEIGAAGVENFDFPEADFGLSLFIPVNEKLLLDVSYYHWQGEDGNLKFKSNSNEANRLFYGNDGFNFSVLYNVYVKNKFSAFIGIGLGGYKFIGVDVNNRNIAVIQTTLLAKYRLSNVLSLYSKNLFAFEKIKYGPSWGLFNLGLEIHPF